MLRRIILATLCAGAASLGIAAPARWESDLRQMGYLFLHLSNINAVNGLNLTENIKRARDLFA